MILTLAHGAMFKTALKIQRMSELNIYGPTTPNWVDRVRRMPFKIKLNVGENTEQDGEASGWWMAPWLESNYDKE